MFTQNVGGVDTAFRAVLGTVIVVLCAFVTDAHPFPALAGAAFATVILTTAIAGVCPLYAVLRFDTRPKQRPLPQVAARHELVHQH